MKQLTCEMCGSTDLMKQDGVFVCQSCGTKYSVEEAKKMMVEIDNSEKLKNYYTLARRAKESENHEDAYKYYDLIRQEAPNDWEAVFYSVYSKACICKIAEIDSAAISVQNCISIVFSLIKDHILNEEQRAKAVNEVCQRSFLIAKILKTAAKEHLDSIGLEASMIELVICDELCKTFNDDNTALSAGLPYLKKRTEDGIGASRESIYLSIIRKFEPDFDVSKIWEKRAAENARIVQEITEKTTPQKSSGCYVATAVYGSYDCPPVWTLRRFRDYTLAETWYGRAFIRTYYAISPTLVKWFGHTEWFKNMWKGKLDRMVANLNAEGVENTPYEDKVW